MLCFILDWSATSGAVTATICIMVCDAVVLTAGRFRQDCLHLVLALVVPHEGFLDHYPDQYILSSTVWCFCLLGVHELNVISPCLSLNGNYIGT